MSDMVPVRMNNRWTLNLPAHRQQQWAEPWEAERLDAMHQVIRSGDTVVDVGAEEGDISALCASWAGPDGRMVLIEPQPKYWPNIKACLTSNRELAPLVDWFVGFAAAETELEPPNDNIGIQAHTRLGWPNCAWGEVTAGLGFRHLAQEADATPRITLDHLGENWHWPVDVITIDVEGAELEVLKGARRLLTDQRPVVFVSVHPEFMRDMYRQHPDELHTFMYGLGYHGHHLASDHEVHTVYWADDGRVVPWG